MKTLQEIKNNYAQELDCKDWQDLIMKTWSDDNMEKYYDEICIRAQKEALKKAAENAKMTALDFMCDCGQSYNDWSIDRNSITNPENLIR